MTTQEIINKKAKTVNNYSQNGFNTIQLNEILEEYGKEQYNEAIKDALKLKYTLNTTYDSYEVIDEDELKELIIT